VPTTNASVVSPPILRVPVHIGHLWPEQPVGVAADLVGGSIVYSQGLGAAADIDTQGFPGERRLEDALSQIAREEQRVGTITTQRGQKAQFARRR